VICFLASRLRWLTLTNLDSEYWRGATGFGCRAVHADTTEVLAEQFTTALTAQGPTVIVVRTQPMMAHLG
jgi:thiamine pyrophosphate-dependent acetolactate synthase large subunit-like protein